MADESDFQLQNSAQSIEYGRECVRSGILINGGAAVAILAFLSSERAPDAAQSEGLRWALVAFSVGVGSAFIASALGYWAQAEFATINYLRQARRPAPRWRAHTSTALGVAAMVVSIVSFILGVWAAAGPMLP